MNHEKKQGAALAELAHAAQQFAERCEACYAGVPLEMLPEAFNELLVTYSSVAALLFAHMPPPNEQQAQPGKNKKEFAQCPNVFMFPHGKKDGGTLPTVS